MRPLAALCALFVTALGVVLGVPFPAAAEPSCAVPVPAAAVDVARQADRGDESRSAHSLADGHGVKVGVIDTGVAPHPRLGEVIDGGNFVGEGTAFDDCDSHGTVVAGIIRATDEGDGVIGVAPGAQIISIRQTSSTARTADEHAGTVASLADSIHRALDLGAGVINISVVSCLPPDARVDIGVLDGALARAEDQGTVVVAASGNEAAHCPRRAVVLPASRPTVLAVTAHEDPHNLSSYALPARGALSAPGHVHAGLTHVGLSSGIESGGGTVAFEGTSFAAPQVSGLAALLRQRHPGASAAELREMLRASTDPSTGAVNARTAVGMLSPRAPSPRREQLGMGKPQRIEALGRMGTGLGLLAGATALAAGVQGRRVSNRSPSPR